jgi:4'-phosphopantetheinyl transferase
LSAGGLPPHGDAEAPSLPADVVDIWSFPLDVEPARLEALRTGLSPDENERAARFVFPVHRDRFRAGRGQLREILARYLRVAPSAVAFEYGPQGKPRLAGRAVVHFNLSHAEHEAVVAVARDRELGIDLEMVRTTIEYEPLAQRFFSPPETKALLALPSSARPRAFYEYWTCKEAFLKAKGGGLNVPLDEFEVSVGADSARIVWTAWDPREAGRWSLSLLPAPVGFAAALAVQGGRPRLRSRDFSTVA